VKGPRFSGSELSLEKAVVQSDTVVIAILVKLGVVQPTAPGQAAYERTNFKVTKVLKGTCGDSVSVRVIVMNHDSVQESTPAAGQNYILFIRNDESKERIAAKVVPATSENIASVESIIGSQSAH
jgi:hypothetical protein